MRAKIGLSLTLALVGLLVLVPGAASNAAPSAWDAPITLSLLGGTAAKPQLVTDGTTITATWESSDGSTFRIQASSSTDGGTTWSTPADLSAAGQGAFYPQLVTDGTTITATWQRVDGSGFRIQASSSTDGGTTWSTPADLSAAAPGEPELAAPDEPELAATGLGDQTITLSALALVLLLGGITVLGSRTMAQRTARRP